MPRKQTPYRLASESPLPGTPASQSSAAVLNAAISWLEAREDGDGDALALAETALERYTRAYRKVRQKGGAAPAPEPGDPRQKVKDDLYWGLGGKRGTAS